MSRIKLTDNEIDMISKLSDNNPGAMNALMTIIEKGNGIDPQSAFGVLAPLLNLDTLEIYGTDILFNDKCKKNVRRMLLLLRSVQLGILSSSKIRELAKDQMRKINLTDKEWQDLDNKVCAELTEFAKE